MTTLMIVDDESDVRRVLRRLLESEGFEVIEASNGSTALDVLETARPALVITDMMMPVMTGVELIEHLRADPATASIPILAVTGTGNLAEGADATVDKPYSWDRLITVVRRLLDQQTEGSAQAD